MTSQDVDIQTKMPEVEDKVNKRAEVTTVEDRKDEKAAASASKTENKKAAASAMKTKNKKASSAAKKTDLNEVAEEIELSEYEKYVAGKRKSNEEYLRNLGLVSVSKSLTVQKKGKKKGDATKATEGDKNAVASGSVAKLTDVDNNALALGGLNKATNGDKDAVALGSDTKASDKDEDDAVSGVAAKFADGDKAENTLCSEVVRINTIYHYTIL